MLDPYLTKILTAKVYAVAEETPLHPARKLSTRLGCEVLLKREDQQPVFSFKLRGAYNMIARLSADVLAKGVVCASAGNHAQGVALAASRLGSKASIVMPSTTPPIKIEAVRALGGEVILHGITYDEASDHAKALAASSGRTLIHPFDDPDVIAGQGTVGMEILRQCDDPIDAVFLPVGGGGLAAGVAVYLKQLSPSTKIYGVEPEECASMARALEAGAPVTLDSVGIFADGVSVRRVGDETFALCQRYLDGVILVSNDEICAAIKDIFLDTRTLAEPAGALAVAGLKRWHAEQGGEAQRLAAVVSGANMNFDRLVHVAERAALGEHSEGLFAVQIPERPGSFLRFCETLGKRAVTEFNYRMGDPARAQIFVGVKLEGGLKERNTILSQLRAGGYEVEDLSDNEMAKTHIRHMVGGKAPGITDERLLRFEFPERPGALLDFLCSVGTVWNISLFHYRNHGSDYGRVLAGVQVPASDDGEFRSHLTKLGYAHWEVSDNPACRLFLG